MVETWVEELFKLISSRELSLESISAAQNMKREHFPGSLFKFREVNDYSLSNLRDSTLHLTFASRFNDPYDSAVDFDPHFGTTHVELLLNGTEGMSGDHRSSILSAEDPMLEMVRYYHLVSTEEHVDEDALIKMAAVMKELHAGFVAKLVNDMNRRLQNSYKICSLTERLDSLPLWAHYGDNHAGFAMEYDFSSLPADNLAGLCLWPVRYGGVFNASELLRGIRPGDNFNNLFGLVAALHKSPDWEYEKEWRLVLIDGANDPPRNFYAPLKSVFLGSKISEEDEGRVIQNAKVAEVPVFKMHLVSHEFRMEAKPYQK
jgi:hypothetical protein